MYSMSQVETITGIKSHTLRIWERRYEFLKPKRTKSNIRFYSDQELRKLLNINLLINTGYRVSKIDQMTEEEFQTLVLELHANPSGKYADDINMLVLSMLNLNEEDFEVVFKRNVMRNGLLTTVTDLIYPFLDHVGILWSTFKAIPAQEHFISNLIRQKIISAIDSIPNPRIEVPKIIFFLPEGETHEIGLLLATYIAKDLGWKIFYLGQNVPFDNIVEIQDTIKADLMMTILVNPFNENFQNRLNNTMEAINIPILVSGFFEENKINRLNSSIQFLKSPKDFIIYLNHFNSDS